MHCKRFVRMTYLENIAKQGMTLFVGDALKTEEKN